MNPEVIQSFFGKNIGLSKAEANSLFIKANYTWTSGKMVGGYKAFDLQGKEIEPTIDGNAIEAKKEIIETNSSLPTITISNKNNSSQNSNEIETSELDRFIEIARNTVGATYDHTRSPTKSKMDCSGVFVYAMQQLGYKLTNILQRLEWQVDKYQELFYINQLIMDDKGIKVF